MRRRVLVIDDEPSVRFILDRVLRATFEVTCCGSADEALTHLRGERPFDVILCDLTMSGMSGIDLYRRLEVEGRVRCERVIFVTGGAFAPDVQRFLDSVPNAVVEKPFELEDLRAAIARVLGSSEPL